MFIFHYTEGAKWQDVTRLTPQTCMMAYRKTLRVVDWNMRYCVGIDCIHSRDMRSF